MRRDRFVVFSGGHLPQGFDGLPFVVEKSSQHEGISDCNEVGIIAQEGGWGRRGGGGGVGEGEGGDGGGGGGG